ncbi:MAG: tetratricopeptide repeat protein [Elusimicrobium sp.]|jgi:tetratricopeptide (TPR) repeat protein|nr:tetratricopeptide repeat protein [Elusimicrobium sp.]
MKKFLFIILILTYAPAFAAVADGDAAYAAGNFTQALENYENALASAQGSAYLYYNIGNSYFKLGELGKATAYYAKAFAVNPRDTDIRQNLSFALAKSGQNLVPDGMPPALHKAFFIMSGAELKGLFFILLWLLCFALVFYIFKKKGKRVVFTLAFAAAFLLIWYAAHYFATDGMNAVTVARVTQLRSGPDDTFEVTATLPEGYFVDLKDKKDDWVLAVNYKDDNMSGWAKKSNFISTEVM